MSTSNPFKSLQALANLTALLETNKVVVLLPSPDGTQGTLETLGNISIADFKNFILAQVNQEITDLQNKPGNGAFASPINFNLTGPVTGTVAFDGSTDVTLPTIIADGSLSIGMVSGLGTQLTALQTDLDSKLDSAQAGVAGGVATLDSNGLVPTWQLPSYMDDVIDVADFASLPAVGEGGKIYVTADNSKIYRWSGSTYVWIDASVGSADTATRWATARNLNLAGVLSGTVSLDGSADVNLTAALVDGSIDNIKLKFSTITFGTTAVNLGDTVTALAGLTSVSSTTFVGALTGNADTATKWAAAVTLTLGGVLSGSALIDGSGNVTLSASMPDGSIATSAVYGLDTALAGKLDSGATAASAVKWVTPITFSLSGPVTGSVLLDGSADTAMTVTIADGALSQAMVNGLPDALTTLQGNINAKLDTNLYTAASVLAKLITVDGATSGLDADLLDGQEGSFYQNAANLNAGIIPAARAWALTGDVTTVEGNVNATISDKAVTLAKLADLPLNSLIGRQSDSAGVPQAIAIGSGLTLSAGVLSSSSPIPTDPSFTTVSIGADSDILLYETVANNGVFAIRTGTSGAYNYFTFGADGKLTLTGTSLTLNGKSLTVDGAGNLAFNMAALYNNAGFALAVGGYYWNYSTDGSLAVPGNVAFANGNGITSAAGAAIKTGAGGGTWSVQRAAAGNSYFALNDENGTAQWNWTADGNLTTNYKANLGGLALGSAVAASATDLSRHIALYGGSYGFSITGNTINYVAGGGQHNFLTGSGAGGTVTAGDYQSTGSMNPQTSATSAAFRAQGNYGGGFGMVDGAYGITLYSTSGNLCFGFGSSSSVTMQAAINADGAGNFSRVFAGYDSGIAGAVSCSQWFRSNGATGWYNASYGGGWYMTDTTYVRSYQNKPVVASDFVISSDARLKTAIMPFQFKGRLNPVHYTLIENGKSGFGFIAQEVQEFYPEAVGVVKETGMLQVSYSKLTAVLAHQINALEDEFTKMRRELDELRAHVYRVPWWKRWFRRTRAPAK